MRRLAKAAAKGQRVSGKTELVMMIEDYITRRALAKLGVRVEFQDFSDSEIAYLVEVDAAFQEAEQEAQEAALKKMKQRRHSRLR